jgi:hypothetical protein
MQLHSSFNFFPLGLSTVFSIYSLTLALDIHMKQQVQL